MDHKPVPKLSELKSNNRRLVLRSFLDQQPHDVNEIAASVGVSRQTVIKSLSFFIEEELIVPTGKGQAGASGGKRPQLYALSPRLFMLCVTLWDGLFRVNLFNLNGILIDHVELNAPLPPTPESAVENIVRISSMLLKTHQIDLVAVRGVSVSIPGNVDRKTNRIIYSIYAPQWGGDIPLAEMLKPFFAEGTLIILSTPSKINSSVYIIDPRYNKRRVLVLSISHGITGCLIENGHILNGTHSLIGEIGHMNVFPSDPELCSCGSHGCLEVMTSPARLRRLIEENRDSFPRSPLLRLENPPDYNAILREDQNGDELAGMCAEYLAGMLSIALHNVILVFDPDFVIFSGKDFIGNEAFSDRIYRHVEKFRYLPGSGHPFEIVYDDCDMVERDAIGSMISLRWLVLNEDQLFVDQNLTVESQEETSAASLFI